MFLIFLHHLLISILTELLGFKTFVSIIVLSLNVFLQLQFIYMRIFVLVYENNISFKNKSI